MLFRSLGKFLTGLPARFETATGNPRLNAVIVEADEKTGLATHIERLSLSVEDFETIYDVGSVRSSV